ncbi:MAG: T9SS type A sorting domain-containing protein [Bacteroidota bacterium]|nr:T9SS type A sorting domain-containing protein [Bacteroidota bacterium]
MSIKLLAFIFLITIQFVNGFTGTITGPSIGLKYNLGTTLTFCGIAKDSSGNVVKKNNFIWRAHYRHEEHWHDNLASLTNDSVFLFELPQKGEFTSKVFYRVELITPYGIRKPFDTTFYDALPDTSKVTFKTIPSGLTIKLFGTGFTSDFSISEVENGVLPISFQSVQTLSGVEYRFSKWSFGSTFPGQVFYTPKNDTTFTIEFLGPQTSSGTNQTTTGTNTGTNQTTTGTNTGTNQTTTGTNTGTNQTITGYSEEFKNNTNFKISPNPFIDFVEFDMSTFIEIKQILIINIEGKTILNIVNPESKIILKELPAGLYYIKLLLKNGQFIHQKLIKHSP